MTHPEKWVENRPEGLYIIPADCYIDPLKPVATAIVTHGHTDHARSGHCKVYTTSPTHSIMNCRYGDQHTRDRVHLDYGQTIELGDGVRLTLVPAGHIWGSAQVVMDYGGTRLVVSGDYKRQPDPTCAPFEPVVCDVFITEATFALPVFNHPPIDHEVSKLLQSLACFPERCHLVGVYALGKCQRLMLSLRQLGYDKPIYLHGALVKLCELYEQHGCQLGPWQPVSTIADKDTLAGCIVLAPPSALADRWSRRLPHVITAMASGWLQIRARSRQRRVELPLVISDHCDWNAIVQTLEEVKADEVWITHGRETALLHHLTAMGKKAKALSMLGYEEGVP